MSPKLIVELIAAGAVLLTLAVLLGYSKLARTILVEALKHPRTTSHIEIEDPDEVRPQMA